MDALYDNLPTMKWDEQHADLDERYEGARRTPFQPQATPQLSYAALSGCSFR